MAATLPAMTGDDLTCEQAAILSEQVGKQLAYFSQLRDRMERTHWEQNDRAYRLVKDIRDKLQDLHMHFYYLSVPSGVNHRPRR